MRAGFSKLHIKRKKLTELPRPTEKLLDNQGVSWYRAYHSQFRDGNFPETTSQA
jgi:hypothetical protein